jgi:predicted dehydrogenase
MAERSRRDERFVISAAIVGLGRWGQRLVSAVQGKSERIRFVRGMVRNPGKVTDFAKQHDFALSGDYGDVLADPRVQAVVLATPHSAHVGQIVAAARAGKAVLCEKPLALTRADAERAVGACEEAGVVLAVGHDKRHWASMRELARVVRSGELGEILLVEGNSSNEVSLQHYSPWRESEAEAPGVSMTATGVHIVDAFVNLIGPVKRVQAQALVRKPAPGPVDSVSVMLEFANGASGVICSARPTPYFWRVHVFGTRGSAEAIGETELVVRMSGEKPRRLDFEPVDQVRVELELFADAIEGRNSHGMSSQQIIDTVGVFEAACESMRTGGAVPVETTRRRE